MTVTEINRSVGSWSLRLRDDTPRSVLRSLEYLGHVAIVPGRLNVAQYGDALLDAARYVGVYRGQDREDEYTIKGAGMAFWLGDEDGKGDVLESEVNLAGATFSAAINAVLPPSGSIVAGTIHSVAGTYNGRHVYETPRSALDYITDTMGAEWRVNPDGTLDAGTVAQLYVVNPTAVLVRRADEGGSDLFYSMLPGRMAMGTDVEDYTTRVLLLAEGEGTTIATGDADLPVVPFKDIHGNTVKLTRLISESGTVAGNAAARAQLQLNRFSGSRNSVSLSTSDFDVKGNFIVGDYVYVYDPDTGFVDTDNEIVWKGQPINPIALRCIEMTWPVRPGWTVGFRRGSDGVWVDLTEYIAPETGDTTIVVGEFSRSLLSAEGEPLGNRPNTGGVDTSIPGVPAFTGFSTGSYISGESTRAAIRAQWTTPLNIDTSAIVDGDHYEIRYRVNETINYSTDWDTLETFTWDDVSVDDVLELNDTFGRTETDQWGGEWTVSPAAQTASFDVTPGAATCSINAVNSSRRASFAVADWNRQEIVVQGSWPTLPTGGNLELSAALRYDDVNHPLNPEYYFYETEITPAGEVRVRIVRRTDDVALETTVGPAAFILPGVTYTPGTRLWIRAKCHNDIHMMKVWTGLAGAEPTRWTIVAADNDPLVGQGHKMGIRMLIGPGVTTTLPIVCTIYSVSAWTYDPQRTWDAPSSEAISALPEWQTAFVGWGTNAFTLTELTPSVNYELQIRAVDAATPPNVGSWSASSFVVTQGDTIAPATPAMPEVASSRIAIQVTHRLGRASGGEFNMDLDLDHIEVHVGGAPTFFANASTKVGELIANATMVMGNIPAVGTFQIESTEDIWVKVIAVDRAGNKSGASEAVQASALLIDDAHISDLTVSKVTAGTITATWVNAGRIATANDGLRVEMNGDGLDVYNNDGYRTARLDGSDGLLKFWKPPYTFHPLEIGVQANGRAGMRVQDLFGVTKLVVGELDPNGAPGDTDNYGLAVVNSVGEMVSLATIAFGVRHAFMSGTVTTNSSSYVGLGGGPFVDVVIGSSCKVIILISARMSAGLTTAGGPGGIGAFMSYDKLDLDSGWYSDADNDQAAILVANQTSGLQATHLSQTVAQLSLFTVPVPGRYRFNTQYRSLDGVSVSFQQRNILAIPY